MDLKLGTFLILTISLGFIAQSSKSSEDKIDFHVTKKNNYVGDDFVGKDIILVDDMINTGTTLYNLATSLKAQGCGKIYAFVYHDLMTTDAVRNLEESRINELVILNTNKTNEGCFCEKIVRLKISKVLSKYIGEMIDSYKI